MGKKELIGKLLFERRISGIEAENIDIDKILSYTKSNLWQEVRKAKIVEREKQFYTTVSVKDIYGGDIQDEILVQGVIDLYYINDKDELILVDYKTDYVTKEEELIDKYAKQLELYQKALEEALNKKVSNIYIYSTYLNKVIKLLM